MIENNEIDSRSVYESERIETIPAIEVLKVTRTPVNSSSLYKRPIYSCLARYFELHAYTFHREIESKLKTDTGRKTHNRKDRSRLQ